MVGKDVQRVRRSWGRAEAELFGLFSHNDPALWRKWRCESMRSSTKHVFRNVRLWLQGQLAGRQPPPMQNAVHPAPCGTPHYLHHTPHLRWCGCQTQRGSCRRPPAGTTSAAGRGGPAPCTPPRVISAAGRGGQGEAAAVGTTSGCRAPGQAQCIPAASLCRPAIHPAIHPASVAPPATVPATVPHLPAAVGGLQEHLPPDTPRPCSLLGRRTARPRRRRAGGPCAANASGSSARRGGHQAFRSHLLHHLLLVVGGGSAVPLALHVRKGDGQAHRGQVSSQVLAPLQARAATCTCPQCTPAPTCPPTFFLLAGVGAPAAASSASSSAAASSASRAASSAS